MANAVLLLALLGVCPVLAANQNVNIKLISPEAIKMNMGEIRDFPITLNISLSDVNAFAAKNKWLDVTLRTETVLPQIKALEIIDNTHKIESIPLGRIAQWRDIYSFGTTIRLRSLYIGHAQVSVLDARLYDGFALTNRDQVTRGPGEYFLMPQGAGNNMLRVTVVQHEGIWGKIFIASVTLFIVISYVNLGAQLDPENMKQMMKKPKAIALGFLITVLVMPLISWFVSAWLLGDQLLYRAGSFIFACGPAASASTLWTAMLDADKELSVGLQVVSMTGALFTMPILLYFMDAGLQVGQASQSYQIQVPYIRLLQTLLVLVLALFVGWRFVGQNKRARQISTRIFKPLTFFVLIFIIVFSSIIYWHIYRMFDWTITLASFIITVSAYLITGSLGYLIGGSRDQAIAVSIGSTYKNSGIAFAILVVTFETPDSYIAYVPCLTQVVTTSLTLYLFYLIVKSVNYLKRRGQPEPIQATVEAQETVTKKERRSGSDSDKSTKSEENADEFIDMNVTDIVPGSPLSQNASHHIQVTGNDEREDKKE